MIRIHGNINKKCMSVKNINGTDKTVKHFTNKMIVLNDVDFIVQQSGHQKIASGQQNRSVVAYIKGNYKYSVDVKKDSFANNPNYIRISYNPIKNPQCSFFYLDFNKEQILKATEVIAIHTDSSNGLTKLNVYIKK